MKSQTGRPSGTCPASAAKTEGDLRTNWQHPCFQCNCTYLVSHLRGSLRGCGLIEQSIAECRGEWSQSEPILGPLRQSQTFSKSDMSAHTGHFQSVCLIAPPLRLTNVHSAFLFNSGDPFFTGQRLPAHFNRHMHRF